MKVADILKGKAVAGVMTVKPSETIAGFAKRLKLAGVGAMVVSDDGHAIEGIISERDIAYAVPVHGAAALEMRVSEVMTKTVITCSPTDNCGEVAKIMITRRIRHLPVKEEARLIGLISIGDVLKARLSEMEIEANVLRDIAIAGR
jgi:CBS domain-containing protein